MARWIGSPRAPVPHDRRLALVGDADRGDVAARQTPLWRSPRAPSPACRARCPRRRARPSPAPGSAAASSRRASATARPRSSNTMLRVEVVPWSMARTCRGRLIGSGRSVTFAAARPQSRAFLKPARSGNIRRTRARPSASWCCLPSRCSSITSIAAASPSRRRCWRKSCSLSASEMGWVLAVFYWAYAPMQPVMGWCADRFGPARVLAAGFLLWSLATALDRFRRRARRARRAAAADGRRRSPPSTRARSACCRETSPATQRGRATATMQFGAVRRARRSARCSAGSSWCASAGGRCSWSWGSPRCVWLFFWRRWMRSPQRRRPRRRMAGDDPPYAPDPAAACAVGRHDGHVLLQLCFLLRVLLAAAVSRERARAFVGRDGADGDARSTWRRCERAADRLAARSLGRRAAQASTARTRPRSSSSSAGVGLCLIASSQVTGLAAARRDPAADRRDGRPEQPLQSVSDADICRPARDGTLDGHPERRRQCRGHDGAGRDRIPGAANAATTLRR